MITPLNPKVLKEIISIVKYSMEPIQLEDEPKPKRIYKTKPKDPEYFKKYYHTKVRCVFECPVCGMSVVGNAGKLAKHTQTKQCRRFEDLIMQLSGMSLSDN